MKISILTSLMFIFLGCVGSKFPNQPLPQNVKKIYIVTSNALKKNDGINSIFFDKLKSYLNDHKVESLIKEIQRPSTFIENKEADKSEQIKAMDIKTFKPDIILEVSIANFALKKGELSINDDLSKLINEVNISAQIALPNQYTKVWTTHVNAKDPDKKANTVEGCVKAAVDIFLERLKKDKIIQ